MLLKRKYGKKFLRNKRKTINISLQIKMQYKIPVQVENEDPIFLWLSLRQLFIIIAWWGIAYSLFKSLAPRVWWEIAAIPSIVILIFFIIVAIIKLHEMTFVPLILSILRFNVNAKNRKWDKWVDSFQSIDIWYVTWSNSKKEEKIDFTEKIDKMKELDEKISKI